MTFKRLTSPSAGDSTHFGGLDVNKFSDFLGGTDISGSETIDINSATKFRDSKLRLRNPANNAEYIMAPAAIAADRTLNLPLLTGTDTIATLNTITGLDTDSLYTIYISGTTTKARNNVTGIIDYTDTTGDATLVINSAINNIQNVTGAGLDTTYAGTIRFAGGKFTCKTTINIVTSTTNRRGIRLVGAGPATILDFAPTGALTNGILLDDTAESGLSHMRIQANSNVTNYIKMTGPDTTTQWKSSMGYIDDVYFQGANFLTTALPVAGTVGILIDEALGTPYFWHILNCHFLSIETGIKANGFNSTATFCNNLGFLYVTTAIDIGSAQHVISNVWHQGTSSAGLTTIRLRAGGTRSLISNIQSELQIASPTECQCILLDSGATNNFCTNIGNGPADGTRIFIVKDNSGSLTNTFFYKGVTDGAYLQNAIVVDPLFRFNLAPTEISLRQTAAAGNMGLEFGPNHATGGIPYMDWHTDSGDGDYRTRFMRNTTANGTFDFYQTGTGGWLWSGGPHTFSDAINFVFGTTTGTKIGTATNQKIGFYNATPIIQGASIADVNTGTIGGTWDAAAQAVVTDLRTKVNSLISRMEALGLIATV